MCSSNYDKYNRFKQILNNQNDNTSIIIVFKNKKTPLLNVRLLDIDYDSLTINTLIKIGNSEFNTITILDLSSIESLSVYDRFQYKDNNLNNIVYLEELYKK